MDDSEIQDVYTGPLVDPKSIPERKYIELENSIVTGTGDVSMSKNETIKNQNGIFKAYIDSEGFSSYHIRVFNRWLAETIKLTIGWKTLQTSDKRIISFHNFRILPPRYTRDGTIRNLTPKLAREQAANYSGDCYIDAVMSKDGITLETKSNICIGSIPIMLKSDNCILKGKTAHELELLGEDPNDPGGYFIIKGSEKVVLLQEQLAVNRILLMNMNTGIPVARLTANTSKGTSLIELCHDRDSTGIIEVRFNSLKPKAGEKAKGINVLRFFRLLGVVTTDEGAAPENSIDGYLALFIKPEWYTKCIYKLVRSYVDYFSNPDDIEVMTPDTSKNKNIVIQTPKDLKEEKIERVRKILEDDLFPHLNNLPGPDGETEEDRIRRIYQAKAYLLTVMLARYLENMAGYRKLDDRDSWSNKRIEGAGRTMESLFRNSWRNILSRIQAKLELSQTSFNLSSIVAEIAGNKVITESFISSFITSNWGVKGSQVSQMKSNVAQTLFRDSVPATLSHLATVDVSVSRNDRQPGLRLIQMSQWGYICPVLCTEGENCGIIKNLACTVKIAIERNDTKVIRLLINQRLFVSSPPPAEDQSLNCGLMVNGKFLGWCNGDLVYNTLLNYRREGTIDNDTTIVNDDNWLYVDVSPSRLIRPLLIVDKNQNLVINTLGPGPFSINELLSRGAIEYISPWEQEYTKIAVSIKDIEARIKQIEDADQKLRDAQITLARVESGEKIPIPSDEDEGEKILDLEMARKLLEAAQDFVAAAAKIRAYTHCEIDPQVILSVAGALIPWPEHNQAPRNTYQASMAKQALGIYHTNHRNRMTDDKTKLLVTPERPILEPQMFSLAGLDNKSPGQNTVIAFMSIPFTEEDSFVVKKEYLERGGMRMWKYFTYKTIIKTQGNIIEKLELPSKTEGTKEPEGRYRFIQDGSPSVNGLPMIGGHVREGDCIISKNVYETTKTATGETTKQTGKDPVILRVGDEGIIDKVLVTSDDSQTIVTVKLRTMRIPMAGDKFAPRFAQKGTIGLVANAIDMPVSKEGITPDFIVNPSCFVADTPILLKNGLAKRIVDLDYDGFNKVWAFQPETMGFIPCHTMSLDPKGKKSIVKVTLSDGRVLRCTPDHKFTVFENKGMFRIYREVPISEVTENMEFIVGLEGVLDAPTPEERKIEKEWKLTTAEYLFTMDTDSNREKALAFARIVGYVCTDGHVGNYANQIRSTVCLGSEIDVDTFLDDIELITGKRPKPCFNVSQLKGSTYTVTIPSNLARSIASLNDMTIGRRTTQIPLWPSCFVDNKAPKSIVREFLAGVMGGDGWAPYLVTNKQDGHGTVTFNPPAISQSSTKEQSSEIMEKMQELVHAFEYVGVPGGRVENPKIYDEKMVTCVMQLPRGTEFAQKVGFRYCAQKMYRLAAYQSYMRYLSEVKRQNDHIVNRASQIFDAKLTKNSIATALTMAREEFYAHEKPLNQYYSLATTDQVSNRRRADRFKELKKWDYNFIEDADAYLRKINAYHWFRTPEGTGGADYIVKQHDNQLPYFKLTLHDIREDGVTDVYDISVSNTHKFSALGVSVLNCIPSRMTVAYIMELLASKHGAYRAVRVDGSPFQPFEMNKFRTTLTEYKVNEFGYEELFSGNSGNPLDALIYMGPVLFQALKHHVADKIQARSTGSVKTVSRQPVKGKGYMGGLRFGEMERDAAISHGASAFLRERLMLVSDGYKAVFCRKCGSFAVWDPRLNNYKCPIDAENGIFGKCIIPYAYKLLIHLLSCMGIHLRPGFITTGEYVDNLYNIKALKVGDNESDSDAEEENRLEAEEENNATTDAAFDIEELEL